MHHFGALTACITLVLNAILQANILPTVCTQFIGCLLAVHTSPGNCCPYTDCQEAGVNACIIKHLTRQLLPIHRLSRSWCSCMYHQAPGSFAQIIKPLGGPAVAMATETSQPHGRIIVDEYVAGPSGRCVCMPKCVCP